MGNTCSEIDNRTTTAAPTTTTTTTAVPIVRVAPVTTRSGPTTQAPVPATTTLAVAATKAKSGYKYGTKKKLWPQFCIYLCSVVVFTYSSP